MSKNKKQTVNEEIIADQPEIILAVKETPAPVEFMKPKLSPAQIKELLKDYSKVTLKARGII